MRSSMLSLILILNIAWCFENVISMQVTLPRKAGNLRNSEATSDLNIAVCVAGGLNTIGACSHSLRTSLIDALPNRANISLHVVTWEDYGVDNTCLSSFTSAEGTVRAAYKGMNVARITVLSHVKATNDFYSDLPHLDTTIPAFERGVVSPYLQATLMEHCANVAQNIDVVIRVRPDYHFQDEFKLRWEGRDKSSHAPLMSFMGKPYTIRNDHVFVLTRKDETIDDGIFLGSRSAMTRAMASLRPALAAGDYNVSDEVAYMTRYPDDTCKLRAKPLLSVSAPWKECQPEVLLQHHFQNVGLHMTSLGRVYPVVHLLRNCSISG